MVICLDVHVYIYMYIYTYMYIYIHTCTCIYMIICFVVCGMAGSFTTAHSNQSGLVACSISPEDTCSLLPRVIINDLNI